MSYSIKSIFGRGALGQLSTNDYVAWAGEMLVHGFDSHSLRILAALGKFDSTFEAEDYFRRSIKELNFIIPEPGDAIRAYACEIAQQIIDDTISAEEGVRALFRICIATEYESDFIVWFQLDDALDSLQSGNFPFTFESATLENFDEIAKREAKNFIATVCGESAS